MKYLSPEVPLCFYKSIIRPCMECCCQAWVGAPSYYLELLDKLKKRIYRTVGPLLAASLEPLAPRRLNVASFSIGISLVDVDLNCLNWFHFLILDGGLLHIMINCMVFLSLFLDYAYFSSFFPRTARLCQTQLDSTYRMLSFDL